MPTAETAAREPVVSLISYVTRIHFAENVLEDALEAEVHGLDLKRPMVITDELPGRADLVDRLLHAIPRSASLILFETATGIATEAACADAAALFRDSRADSLIGFGGATAISLTKAVGVLVTHPGPLHRFTGPEGGRARIRDVLPPFVAIPTMAESCSEVVGISVLSAGRGPHLTLISPFLVPKVVVCDPTLTLDLPAMATASAGMDTLTHCIETYIATAYNPPADGIARDGLRRAAVHLESAVCDGSDLSARREMMAAALNGALAEQKGLGGVHAMSRALASAGRRPLDHGTLNAVLLPYVLDFNAPAVEPRYQVVKQELGLPPRADLPEAIVRLRERLALPGRLACIGVEADDIDRAAAIAEGDHSNRTNPRRANAEDYRAMMRAAL